MTTFPPFPTGRRIGFWVSDDDIYSGDPIFGNAKHTVPTPQQFFNAYFGTAPFPATMVWTGGLYSSASLSVPPPQEAQWFNQLLSICDAFPNIRIWMIAFINLSGFSIVGRQGTPPLSTGLVRTGFSLSRSGIYTNFTVLSTAGLAPSTTYTIQLLDLSLNPIADITTITTDATGAGTAQAGIPNTTDAQAAAGGYVAIKGTHVGVSVGWQNDQTAAFTTYMQTIKGHPSFLGVLFEPEYFGNTPATQASFQSIVNGVGYFDIAGPAGPGSVGMTYSTYPYFTGTLHPGPLPANNLGIHYGETGTPPGTTAIWTQAVVTNIVDNSEAAPITVIIAVNDINNPAGTAAPAFQTANGIDYYLYMSPILRGWINNDPNYQSNFLKSGASAGGPTPTVLSLKATVVP